MKHFSSCLIYYFFSLQGLIPGPRSYLTTFPNVYVTACGTEFYKQCFPSGSINLGLCCIASHWLSKLPCGLTDALLHFQAQSQDERELFTRQAAADWEMFLLMRAKELSSGMLYCRLDYQPLFGKRARAPPTKRRLDARTCYC